MTARDVIGVDAGGTKTVGVRADASGDVVEQVRVGAANIHVQGPDGVEQALTELLATLDPDRTAGTLCLGMAGVGREAERLAIEGVLERMGLAGRARIESDAYVALVAGAPRRRGIVVISGTGSLAYGVDGMEQRARAGGWGYLLGDEGSAYWLGHAAVRRAIRAADGRGPETTLGDRISQHLGLEIPEGLVAWFYDQERFRHRVAALAPLVESAASDGDDAANELLNEAALHLARTARAVARKLTFSDEFPLVLAGGAFEGCPSLERRLDACLGLPKAVVARLTVEPAMGAVALALDRRS